ncbi:MAG: hypothetical protein HXX13_07375 [Bacteroidetes bacterium]|nr:hypothetical protein [Bacteroidota bacterium]
MKKRLEWKGVVHILGVVLIVIGTVDPLEGSVLIAAGSGLLALTTWLRRDRNWKLFLLAFIMIVEGVSAMFYFSDLGGFGGKSSLSWWWSSLIVPYPIGWILVITLLILRAVRKRNK